MKALTAAQKKIDSILEKSRNEYANIEDELAGYEVQRKAAISEMNKAQDSIDVAGYNAAREKKQNADIAIEMLKGRLEKLETKPLISESEYRKLCDSITSEVQALAESTKTRLTELTDQTVEIYDSYTSELEAADQAIKTLQVDLYKGADLYEVRDGQKIHHSEKKAATGEMWAVATWAGRMKDSQTYQEIVKARGAD